ALGSMSAGHVGPVPLHISARSQRPAAGRHTPGGLKAFGGHSAEVPVQTSATSQSPAAGRHSVFAATNVQLAVQQVPVGSAPTSHCSPGSRTPSSQAAQARDALSTSAASVSSNPTDNLVSFIAVRFIDPPRRDHVAGDLD